LLLFIHRKENDIRYILSKHIFPKKTLTALTEECAEAIVWCVVTVKEQTWRRRDASSLRSTQDHTCLSYSEG